MNRILIFDTETTGLPPYYKKDNKRQLASPIKYLKHWDECRMVEIAWLIYENKECIKKTTFLIKPDSYEIPEEVSKIHGITTELAFTEGKDITFVLNELKNDLETVHTIVAHNIEFDYNVLLSEWLRYSLDLELISSKTQICTMKDFLKNPNERWKKLSQLYYECFNRPFIQEHRAMSDASACADILFYLQPFIQ